MVRFIALNICLFISANALAYTQPSKRCQQVWQQGRLNTVCQVFVRTEAVLQDVNVEPVNGGFYPNYSAYNVRAMALLGSNKCQAAGLQAQFVMRQVNGKNVLVALVQGWRPENRMCTMEYQPVLVPVATMVRGYNSVVSNTFIKNVEELGTEVAVKSSCFEPVFCTMEYQPYVCHSAELNAEFKGSNQCIASEKARRNACFRNIDLSDLSCEEALSGGIEPAPLQ